MNLDILTKYCQILLRTKEGLLPETKCKAIHQTGTTAGDCSHRLHLCHLQRGGGRGLGCCPDMQKLPGRETVST